MRTGDGWPDDAYLDRQPYFRTMPRLLVYETGIHFIDTFRFLLGEVHSVFADLRKLNSHIKGEDCGLVFFTFKNGARAIWDANRYNESSAVDARYTFGEMLLEGNAGSLQLTNEGTLIWKPLGEPQTTIPYEHERKNFAGDCVYFTQRHFVDSLLHGNEFETNGEDYLKNLMIQEAVYKSSSARQVVSL